ncbi:MAG: sensor histidine kinase, partial [Bacteroidota bacterium]
TFYTLQQKRKNERLLASEKEAQYHQEIRLMEQAMELEAINASIDGQEQERKRIAEALHDSMGSLLSAVQMHFKTLMNTAISAQNEKALYHKTQNLIQEAVTFNRQIAYEMMPPTLMKLGLPTAVESLVDKARGPKLDLELDVFGLNGRLPEKLELTLYRSLEELLNNLIKHANASEVTVQLAGDESEITLIVEDNGCGFEYDPSNPNYGMGLSNIQSRIRHHGGTFEVDSSPNNGTTIIINIPKDSS